MGNIVPLGFRQDRFEPQYVQLRAARLDGEGVVQIVRDFHDPSQHIRWPPGLLFR